MDKTQINKRAKRTRSYSKVVEKRLKDEFEEVIHNPSEKNIKKYRDIETAVLAVWLSEVMKDLTDGINQAVKDGKANALSQLRSKGFKKKTESDIFSELASAKKAQVRADLEKVIAGIKSNSRRNISDMRNAFILQKKKLTADFFNTFKKYGVAYFADRVGRRWTLERYIEMVTNTVLVQVERQAFFAKSIEWGNDLVRVVHLGHDEPCPLCQPFEGKVLSITGKTQGYMSVSDAESFGLFHPSGHCYLELAPENAEKYANIDISEENSKYEARLRR